MHRPYERHPDALDSRRYHDPHLCQIDSYTPAPERNVPISIAPPPSMLRSDYCLGVLLVAAVIHVTSVVLTTRVLSATPYLDVDPIVLCCTPTKPLTSDLLAL